MNPDGAGRRNRVITSELFLGSIVAVLTILTAVAAFQASRLSVENARASGRSVRTMLDANAAFLSANQDVTADYNLYGLYLDRSLDDEQLDYYESSFSPALQEALDRNLDEPGGFPFDEEYEEFQFGLADDLYDEVFVLVDLAGEKRIQTQRFQLATFVFAIGLAFSSWASLADDGTRMRLAFAFFAVVAAGAGAVAYAMALLSLT